VLHLDEGIDPQVLATINAIVAAMMVVIFSVPGATRAHAVKLPRTRRNIIDPEDAPRVAYNESVARAGWCCLASTLLMTVHRPFQKCLLGCTGSGDETLIVVASLLTAFGCFWGSFHFLMRYVQINLSDKRIAPTSGFTPPPAT